ncbi:MAG: S8/S53 family peptidase [Rhodothermales bacterium]
MNPIARTCIAICLLAGGLSAITSLSPLTGEAQARTAFPQVTIRAATQKAVRPPIRDVPHDADHNAEKHWIFLDGKPDAHASGASDRALRRRRVRGQSDTAGLNLEVAPSYTERLRQMGIEPIVQSRWLNAVSARLTRDQVDRVEKIGFVRSVRPVALLPPVHPPPSDAGPAFKVGDLDYGPSRLQLDLIRAIAPLERGIDGTGVRLGFLDTPFGGFDHPAFERLTTEGRLVDVRDFVGSPQPAFTHGLSVASVAVGYDPGRLIGPAHGAEVLGAITEYGPTETNREEDYFVAGLEWLESMGVDVVNVSLGYTTFDPGERNYSREDLDGETAVTTLAADRAVELGVVVVTSAGNSGCSSPSRCWYYVSTPADGDFVIAVGAVNADSSRSSFSSFGPTADGRTKPDVAALGTGVYIAEPGGYGFSNGTSFAAPLVSAVVCQMLQVNPTLSPLQVRDILRVTASRGTQPDNALGWGIVNASAAVDAASGVVEEHDGLSIETYPNPATDQVFIHIKTDAMTAGRLEIFDALGRRIRVDVRGTAAGSTTLRVPSRHLASGIYLAVYTTERRRTAARFVVVR